jgi:1,2-diacylglycerol 3-beta-glucosyltransferase
MDITPLLRGAVCAVAVSLGSFVLGVALYRTVLALAYWLRVHRHPPAPATGERPLTRFATLIPAHDEELLIGAAIQSIWRADYPREALAVYVVADNCSDRTADIARAGGARVIERCDPRNPGKGAALAHAIERLDFEGCDAVAIVDADVIVGANFYRAMDRELARGHELLQGYDGLSNPDQTMLTRLIAVTSVMKNLFYNAGKSALGFSPLLMGTGMVYACAFLKRRGWRARGITEDHEEGLHLVAEGYRVRFVHDAHVHAQEAASLRQGSTQRRRWATGTAQLKPLARRTLGRALLRGDWVLAETAFGLLAPPYSKLMNLSLLALAAAALARIGDPEPSALPLALALVAITLQLGEFAAALALMGGGPRYAASIAFAPVFLAWKASIDLRASWGRRDCAWLRTPRIPHIGRGSHHAAAAHAPQSAAAAAAGSRLRGAEEYRRG